MMIVINDLSISAEHSALSESFDFSEQSYSKEFYTNLDGEWNFFEKELLLPSDDRERLRNEAASKVTLPSSFESQTGEVNTYGTYSASIKIPKEYIGKTLAIHIPFQYSAYKLYVDETVIAENGKVGQNSASHVAEMAPKTGYFIAQSDEVLFTMQVSSFDHIRGGFENSIYIGESSVVSQNFNTKMISTLFMNGCIFIIGLFMVLFALYRRQEHLFFIFGMFSILIAIRALFAVPFYYTLIFDMSWLWGTRLEYILTEATSMFYVILLWKWHEKEFSKKIMYGLVMIHIVLMVITLFSQPVFFQALFFNVFYLAIPTFFYMIYIIAKSVRNHNRNAKINLIGMGLIFLAFFNDFAIGQNWYQSITLMLPAVGIYIVIHVVLMSKNFAETTRKTEQLNKELLTMNAKLDDKVYDRTKQLHEANERLKHLALIDSLTGIHNRYSFNKFIEKAFQNATENGTSLALLMLDLDEFKKYNDYYGHISGDRLLKKVATIIESQLPEDSFFARYGGEEFVIVLPNISEVRAYKIAEEVRYAVETALITHPKGDTGIVTFSIGVAVMTKEVNFKSVIELIDAADKQLYRSKRKGRNRVM